MTSLCPLDLQEPSHDQCRPGVNHPVFLIPLHYYVKPLHNSSYRHLFDSLEYFGDQLIRDSQQEDATRPRTRKQYIKILEFLVQKTKDTIKLCNTTISPKILDSVTKHDMTNGVEFLACGVILILLVYVAFVNAPRLRRLEDFPIVGKHEDLYGALVEGTKKVSSTYLKL